MDKNEFDENQLNHVKMQSDLIKIIQVVDECIEHIDSFYCYTMKKKMLAGSNQN